MQVKDEEWLVTYVQSMLGEFRPRESQCVRLFPSGLDLSCRDDRVNTNDCFGYRQVNMRSAAMQQCYWPEKKGTHLYPSMPFKK